MTLILSDNGCVFGGYTSASWGGDDSGRSVWCDNAFLFKFSVAGPFDTVTMLPLKPESAASAIRHHSGAGPIWGNGDLGLSNGLSGREAPFNCNSYCRLGITYADLAGAKGRTFTGSTRMVPADVEVYGVSQNSE